jgi:LDH2 family malate/lactate/ureidoglycolate dehydrogenase
MPETLPPVDARRYRPDALVLFAIALLEAAGLPADRARAVAEILVEGDLLGHTTHGLDMLALYLKELEQGTMAKTGEPEVINDMGAALTWDGNKLPGPWLVRKAIAETRSRLLAHPVVTVVMRRSHHIGCLQAYLKSITDAGLVGLLLTSDPAGAGVAPHGGIVSRITPNPLAMGFPTGPDPAAVGGGHPDAVLIDVSMSTSTNAMVKRVKAEGGRLPGPWLVDRDGNATDDPSAIGGDAGGALLPLGGLDLGHKGFGLGLMVEALTSGLAGYGRSQHPAGWQASVFLQVLDPDAFGGRDSFVRETAYLAELCRTTPVAPGRPPVRLPGEGALSRRRHHLRAGVTLPPTAMPALEPWAAKYGLPLP